MFTRSPARRLLPVVAISAAGALAVPSLASARGMTVDVPKSVTAYKSFGFSWEGDTGLDPEIGGGFISRVVFIRGKKACPANATATGNTIAGSGGSDNIFHSGGFRGADQTYFSRPGTVRACGYISVPGQSDQYEQLFTKTIKVKAKPRRAKLQLSGKKPGSGTYTAGPADILGGTPTSSVTIVIDKGNVVSVAAVGIPNTACSASFKVQTPVSDGVSSNVPKFTGGNRIIGEGFAANWSAPTGDVSVNAGAKSSKSIYGSLTEKSADGSCRGGFGFTAKR